MDEPLTDETPIGPQLEIPMPEGDGDASAWNTRIQQAKERQKWHRDAFRWQTNVDRYSSKGGDDQNLDPNIDVLLPKDFSYTEQKKPLLFYQLAEVMVSPTRPDVSPEAASLLQQVLNELFQPSQMNVLSTVHEILTDCLVPAGAGVLKLGYDVVVDASMPEVPLEIRPAGMDPITGLPTPPMVEMVPNIISEKPFAERVSPIDWFYDAGFRLSDWKKCSWQGVRFRMPTHVAAKKYNIPEDDLRRGGRSVSTPSNDQSLAPDREKQAFGGVEGIEIYYYASLFDPAVSDPDVVRCLVFLDGRDEPVYHSNCGLQKVENNRVVGGLRRIPIYPLTLRYVSDMPVPPSDCTMSRVIVDELSRGRSQMIEQRDRNVPMRWANKDRLDPSQVTKIQNGQTQEILLVSGMAPGEEVMGGIAQSAYPQENFNFNSIGERDLNESWALSSANLGIAEQAGRTATELSQRQEGTANRMGSEQAKAELWFTTVAEGLAAIVQQFSDRSQWLKILGPQGEAQWKEWSKQDIQGEFAFTIRPDSAKRIDQAAERKFRLDALNLLINIPGINQPELIKWAAPSLGLNPQTILAPPAPPQPPPTSVSLNIQADQLSPLDPSFAATVEVLKQRGINITIQPAPLAMQEAIQQNGQPQPGAQQPDGPVQAAPGATPINKHAAAETGKLPGAGSAQTRVQ